MAEIFVSYARPNAVAALTVATALRALGYEVWVDDDLPAHRAFTDVLEEQLRAAGAVVVVWSEDSVKSEWVQAEADVARMAHKLVQLRLDEARLPLPFDRTQCADMCGWSGDLEAPGWRKVVTSLRDLLGAPASAAAKADLPTTSHAGVGAGEAMLAVLAFDNLSGDAEMAFFSDGVSEEILQTVARGSDLTVIGRSSSFQFRGRDKAAAHVGAALRATHVLDGSVRRSGNRVRIAASLIECARETTLWSDRFDRELSDVFALQDEIAGAVAAALKVAFAPVVPPETVDPAAYTLYLKARDVRNRGLLSPTTVVEVIKHLTEATRRSPKFARAWEFLATMQVEHIRYRQEGPAQTMINRADVVAAAETALRLDPGLGAAYQALGALQAFGRFADREALHRKALSVAPTDPTVLTNASLFFAEVGRMRAALEYARQAYAIDPMYPWAASWYAVTLEFSGRAEECCALWKRFCDRWPDNELIAWGAFCAAVNYHDWAWCDDLRRVADERGFESPLLRRTISWGDEMRDATGESGAARLQRARERLERTGVMQVFDIPVLHTLGFADETFELIARSSFDYMFDPDLDSPNGAQGSSNIFAATQGAGLMRDIRFVGLCARLGLCDYWVKTGHWPDCADDGALPYDFKVECRRLAGAGA